jgi:lipopolysaccharide/colanic/teichoic acid biosynthesis glycosyltransferase
VGIASIERKIAAANIGACVAVSLIQHQLLLMLFENTNWAFLGQGNLKVSFIFFILVAALLNGRYFSSAFVFLAGLEHYSQIVRRTFLVASLMGLSIFFFGMPAGRNYLIFNFFFLTAFWLVFRKIMSLLVRKQLRRLEVLLVTESGFISEFLNSYFRKVSVANFREVESLYTSGFDLVLFNDHQDYNKKHTLRVAKLESIGVVVGYITNEMRLQGWSGLQVPIGPHLILINMGYKAAYFMKAFKRIFDLILTIPVVLILLTLSLPLALLYRVVNGSPVLFKQVRVGAHGREFVLLKIRTMLPKKAETNHRSKNSGEPVWVEKPGTDELVSGGKFLRRWSIDELPQLLNVLKGDMSLVGPRPRLRSEIDENYEFTSPIYIHKIKPGLTGIWQISGRNEISPSFAVMLDKYYMDHWSPLVDFQIITKTIVSIILGVGAR